MLPDQLAKAPVDMVMSPHYGTVLLANFGILAVVLVWVANDSRKTRDLLPIFIMLGAGVASLQECIYDVLCNVWYAQYGTTPFYRIFNISVPLWMIPAYTWYVGGQGCLMYKNFRRGMTPGQLWRFYLLFWGANLVLEIPALQIGNIYTYYGKQPFEVLGFPVWMAMTNSLMPIILGAVFSALADVLRGPRALLAVAITPLLVGAAEFSGWPMWLALNSGRGYGVSYAAAVLTLGNSLLIAYLAATKFCKPAKATQGASSIQR
jgi:hypothetical protein